MTDRSDAGAVERLIADVGRLASALEAILARCRSASADLSADKSVPSVKQAIALDEIRGKAAHHLAGIDLVRANAAALTRRAGGDAIGQSDGDPDGWLAVKVNAEGGVVMPYGPLHAGPDRPTDARYRWAPFYLGEPK